LLIICNVSQNRAIRFNESAIRAVGRTAAGVRAIRLSEEDEQDQVVGIVCVDNHQELEILVISEKGYGKRSKIEDYRVTHRSGKGVRTLSITDKTGKLIAIKGVTDNDDLMIITKNGITIRLPMSEIRLSGRATQGVKVINLRNGDAIAAVTNVAKSEEISGEQGDNNANGAPTV
jgi:DNA gyrase subunit A